MESARLTNCGMPKGVGLHDEETLSSKGLNKKYQWRNNFDYVFSMVGAVIGLGNVWRFPYLCYKNGGGAFLVAYWALIVIVIFPLVIIESAIGQMTGFSPTKAWEIVPILKGIGLSAPILLSYGNILYGVLMAWALRWFSASFTLDMVWTKCDNAWNSKWCHPIISDQNEFTEIDNVTAAFLDTQRILQKDVNQTLSSSVEEFWRDHLLQMSSGVENMGGLKFDLALCLIIVRVLTYFSVWKGIAWTSKIVYVTATSPLILLLVVLVRGVTLEGAGAGIMRYLKPDLSKLGQVQVWLDAASQAIFSYGICSGTSTVLSSYNKINHNFFRDNLILIIADAVASFVAGFAIFSVLGYLANVQGVAIDEVADSGPGLVFVVYPAALSLLPLPQFWLAIFFLTVILLGFDTLFVLFETIIAMQRDIFPKLFNRKWSNEIVIAVWSVVFILLGFTMVTRGGIYVIHIVNTLTVSGWCLSALAALEAIAIGWIYGADRMCSDIKRMIGVELPRTFLRICWKFLVPVISAMLIFYSILQHEALTYDNDYVYPAWAEILGWMSAFSYMILIPGVAVNVVWKSPGNGFMEKIRYSMKPTIGFRDEVKQGDEENKLQSLTQVI